MDVVIIEERIFQVREIYALLLRKFSFKGLRKICIIIAKAGLLVEPWELEPPVKLIL